MDVVNIAFAGCGPNARGHMSALGQLAEARIVAVCDLVKDLARRAAELTGAEPYTDLGRMLERDDLDAVYLSLPVFAHGEPELAVVRRGLPFFVEKPVARSMATATQVLKAIRRQHLITCVGYQLRYGAGTVAARRRLQNESIDLVVGRYWCGSGRCDPKSWQLKFDLSGGQILEQATHTLDMMRYLCGPVTEVVSRAASRQLMQIDCPDVHAVLLSFASGCIGSLTTSWVYDPDDWSHANVLHITYADKLLRWTSDRTTLSGPGSRNQPQAADGRQIDRVFVDAVRRGDGSEILSPYADGVKSLELALAVNESARTGQPVRLD